MNENWEEIKYDSVFTETYESLKYSLDNDENYSVSNLKDYLESLYVQQGNDWLGRGEVRDIDLNARISACEVLLSEYNR